MGLDKILRKKSEMLSLLEVRYSKCVAWYANSKPCDTVRRHCPQNRIDCFVNMLLFDRATTRFRFRYKFSIPLQAIPLQVARKQFKDLYLQNRPRDAAPPSSHQVPLALPLLIVVRFVAVAVLEVAGGGGGSGDAAIL